MRVVIGEDEALLRRGLQLLLSQAGIDVVAATADAVQLVDAALDHRPDLVVSDIRMPPTRTDDGLRAVEQIRQALPGTPVLVLSQYVQRRYAVELLQEGTAGVGYLLKQRIADPETFIDDVRRVAEGGTALDPEVVAMMVARAKIARTAVAALTPRQSEVLALMAQGHSNAAIAAALFLTEKAVVQHTSRIYEALSLPVDADAHRRVLAVLRYLNDA